MKLKKIYIEKVILIKAQKRMGGGQGKKWSERGIRKCNKKKRFEKEKVEET